MDGGLQACWIDESHYGGSSSSGGGVEVLLCVCLRTPGLTLPVSALPLSSAGPLFLSFAVSA